MPFFRCLAILSLLLISAMPRAWAQVGLQTGSHITLYGYTFTVTGCSYGENSPSSSGGSCTGDNLVLEGVSTGRGTVTLEVANSTPTSAALWVAANSTNNSYLSFTVSVTPSGQDASQVSAALLTGVGNDSYSANSGCSSNCAATFTSGVTSSGYTMLSVPWANGAQTTFNSSQYNLTSPSNSFSFTESAQLNGANGVANGSTLKLQTLALKLYTTPEPASITVLLLGIGGLAAARRRRRQTNRTT